MCPRRSSVFTRLERTICGGPGFQDRKRCAVSTSWSREQTRAAQNNDRSAQDSAPLFQRKKLRWNQFEPVQKGKRCSDWAQGKTDRYHAEHRLAWTTYCVKLLVLAQARRWLSATEQLHPIAEAPRTPKTNLQLALAIKQPKSAEYVPFGRDFESTDAKSPVISRLLFYAEISTCSDHGYGNFSAPKATPPYTYRELQESIIKRRRLQQRSEDVDSVSRELVQAAADLAAKLRAFAWDAIVLKHLIDFALPSKKRAGAGDVTARGPAGVATEHTRSIGHGTTQPGHAPSSGGDATEHTEDNQGDAKQAHDEPRASAAPEHGTSAQTCRRRLQKRRGRCKTLRIRAEINRRSF